MTRRLAFVLLVSFVAAPLPAVELLDGRLRVHGYAETQLRAINEKFSEELDLAQWYNIVNLEFEGDVAPAGVGPFDAVRLFVRVEGRYDAIYSRGFGLFDSIDTYGNFANRLPRRLRDARDFDQGGTQPTVDRFGRHVVDRHPNRQPAPLAPECETLPDGRRVCTPGERRGFPNADQLFRQRGADDFAGDTNTGIVGARYNAVTGEESEAFKAGVPVRTTDDPARYVHQHIADFEFAFKDIRGPTGANTQVLGPWLPKNFVRAIALNPDIASPFRGRVAPTALADRVVPFGSGERLETSLDGFRYYEGDPALATLGFVPERIDPRPPMIAFIQNAPDDVLLDYAAGRLILFRDIVPGSFGGDFSGVVPCTDPTSDLAAQIRAGAAGPGPLSDCVRGAHRAGMAPGTYQEPLIARIIGGTTESPFRPAPDVSNLEGFAGAAQGLYVPSRGLQRELARDRLDSIRLNYDQIDRSFNRGASQERTKEFKEAYIDLELLDNRLWMRFGLQNIVWGKTELFRTTDQFNPQDLALASLPDLEESRIALWSARAIYSFYDVGPLEDVRVELAVNLDRYEPADTGACGEPYAPDTTCVLTNGIVQHGLTGAGIAGIDRPESPWQDAGDIEIGGRIEWRWDRFSFALTDFWGYEDSPFVDAIFYYDRTVDVETGRPLVASLVDELPGRCASAGEIAPDHVHGSFDGDGFPTGDLEYNSSFASHPLSMTPGGTLITERTATGGVANRFSIDETQTYRGGVGTDDDCLRPGGGAGEANAFRFDQELLDRTNALYNHHANQQLFGWICLSNVGVLPALDPTSCAWTIFGSNTPSVRFPLSFAEGVTAIAAGDVNGSTSQLFLERVHAAQRSTVTWGALGAVPVKATNRLFNDPRAPLGVDRDGDGLDANNSGCGVEGGPCDLGGFDGIRTAVSVALVGPDAQTLDSTLTNEQRALLGCGPFWASRCDSSTVQDPSLIGGQVTVEGSPIYGAYGGVDLLNSEASALLQAWPGFEGTRPGHFATDRIAQPGTIGGVDPATGIAPGFDGGPVCTRSSGGGLVKLPGCRGISSLRVLNDASGQPSMVEVAFEPGYLPSVDGCLLGNRIERTSGAVVQVNVLGGSPELERELALCNGASTQRPVPEVLAGGGANPACIGAVIGGLCNADRITLEKLPLIHPLAGCIDSPVQSVAGSADCSRWMHRDLVDEFLGGTAQLYQNEMAAVSWNFLMFLVVSSCDERSKDLDGFSRTGASGNPALSEDPECFVPSRAYETERCSYVTPQRCRNVKGFFEIAGVTRNTVRAGGNDRFGRRTFLWHSGGEAVLRYEKRNVLGFAMDFAEDVTRSNWGFEFTWIEGVPFADADSLTGISKSDAFNFTISADRPTFIRALNANRTFFFNTQWFVGYIPDHGSGFSSNGPVNVLFTFTASTGYYQDRLLPSVTTVYHFMSQSGGVLPSVQYRLTQSVSVTVGMLYFFGRTQLVDMPVRDIAPATNRVGPDAYKNGVDSDLSLIRKRDELFMRVRWSF
jgi:hypothetical protein